MGKIWKKSDLSIRKTMPPNVRAVIKLLASVKTRQDATNKFLLWNNRKLMRTILTKFIWNDWQNPKKMVKYNLVNGSICHWSNVTVTTQDKAIVFPVGNDGRTVTPGCARMRFAPEYKILATKGDFTFYAKVPFNRKSDDFPIHSQEHILVFVLSVFPKLGPSTKTQKHTLSTQSLGRLFSCFCVGRPKPRGNYGLRRSFFLV